MKILGIETSCDETSVAIVEDGRNVLSLKTASSLDLHALTGGIIPEEAARKQVEFMLPTLEAALLPFAKSKRLKDLHSVIEKDIDAIAVTSGPGLIGSLLVGVETAKTLALVFNKPLIPINHVYAHIYGAFLGDTQPEFPAVVAVVSGGHTEFIYMTGHGEYEIIGGTRDDAAGEAFDKCARVLGLNYPGGPAISKAAKISRDKNEGPYNLFPRPLANAPTNDVSFSGLKTSVINHVKTLPEEFSRDRIAAEVEEAICGSLLTKIERICVEKRPKSLIFCGGVSANARVRELLNSLIENVGFPIALHVPQMPYTTDNAAMVASCAYYLNQPERIEDITAHPEWSL